MSFGETNIQNEWLISKIVEVTEINSYLREEKSNWVLEYDNLMTRFKQTFTYVTEVEEKNQKLAQDKEALQSELKGCNLKLDQASRTIVELQGLLESRSSQDRLYNMQQEQVTARENELKAKVEDLTVKYANSLKESRSQQESHCELVANLEKKIEEFKQSENALNEEIVRLQQDLNQAGGEIRSRKDSEKEVQSENASLASKLQQLEERLSTSDARISQLQSENEFYKSEEERLKKENEDERRASEIKQKENAQLEETVKTQLAELAALQSRNTELEERNLQLQQAVETKTSILDSSNQQQLEDLEREIQVQQDLKFKIELLEITIGSLRDERDRSLEQGVSMYKLLEDSKKLLEENKGAIAERDSQISQLNEDNRQLQDTVDLLNSELEELRANLNDTQSPENIEELKSLIAQKEQDFLGQEIQLTEATEKLAVLSSENDLKAAGILQLESRVAELEANIAKTANQGPTSISENLGESLEDNRAVLEAQIQSLQQSNTEIKQELEKSQEELSFLKSAKKILEMRISELQHANNEKSQVEYKIQELTDQINSLNNQMHRMRERHSAEVQEITEQKNTSEEKLSSVERDYQAKIAELQQQLSSLPGSIPSEADNEELELLKQVRQELLAKIEFFESQTQAQALESARLTKDLGVLKNEKSMLESQIKDLHQNNKDLYDTIEQLNLELTEFRQKFVAHSPNQNAEQLKTEIAKLTSLNDELRDQISNLGAQNSDLETAITQIREQNSILTRRAEQLQLRVDQMAEENSKLMETVKNGNGNELDATNDQTLARNANRMHSGNFNLAQDDDSEDPSNLLGNIADGSNQGLPNQSRSELIARIENLSSELENAQEKIRLLETKLESLQNPDSVQYGFQRQETQQSETTEFLTESKNRIQVEELKEKIKLLEYQIEEYQSRLNTSEQKINTFVSRERELNKEIFESEQREEAIQNALRENKIKMKHLEEKIHKDDQMNQELRDKFSEIVRSNNGLTENPSYSDISNARTKSDAALEPNRNDSRSQISADLLTKSVDLNSPSRKTLIRNDTEKDMISELSQMEMQARKDQNRYNNIQNYIDELKTKLAEVESLREKESKKNSELQKNLRALEDLNSDIQKSNLQAERDREELAIKLARIEEERQSQNGPQSNRTLETFGMRSEKEADHGARTDRSRSDYGDFSGINKANAQKLGQDKSFDFIQKQFDSLQVQHNGLKRENAELKEVLQENQRHVKELKQQLQQKGLNESNLLTLSRSIQNNQAKTHVDPQDESLYTLIESIKHNGMTKNAEAGLVNLFEENRSLKNMMEMSKMDDTSFDGEFGLRLRKKDEAQEVTHQRSISDSTIANSEKLSARVKELEKELLTRIDEITKLVERNEKLYRDLDGIERENSKFRRMLDDKDRTINNLQDSYNRILNENKNKDNSSSENERSQAAYLQKMIELYEDQKQTDKEWIEKLRGELDKERTRALNMESLYLDSKDRIESLSKELIEMKDREKQLLIRVNRFELMQANNEMGGSDGNRANSDLLKEISSLKLQNQKQKGEIETLLKSHNNLEKLVSRKYSKSPTNTGGITDANNKSPFRARYGQSSNDSGFKHSPLDTGILNTSSNTANSIKEDYKNAQSSVDAVRRQIKEIADNHFDDAVYSDGLSSAQRNQSLQKQLHQAERVLLTLSSKMKNLEEKLTLYIRRAEQDSKKSMGSTGYQVRDSSLGQTLTRPQNLSKSPITSEKKNYGFERTQGARSDLTPNDNGFQFDDRLDGKEEKNATGYLDLQSRLTPDEKSALAAKFSNTIGHVGVKDLIETDFIASLKVVLGNICILKQRYGDLKYSYQMIDERVGKMIVFMQKKNPKAIVISQLEEFVNCSVLASIANNIERLNDLENSTHAKIMKELNKLFMKLKKEVEEIKKMIEIRKICLSSIMNRNNFFINDMKI